MRESEVGRVRKLLLVIVLAAAVWGAWTLSQRTAKLESIPIDAKFVFREVRYEAP